MAKFSMKVKGKEIGPAPVYAPPHDMKGVAGVDLSRAGYQGGDRGKPNDVNMTVGNLNRNPYPEPKTSGIKTRGNGAATKGVTARGPMA